MTKVVLIVATIIILAGGYIYLSKNKKVTTPDQMIGQEAVQPPASEEKIMAKEISMTAKQFEFDPATITVKKGEKVRLKIKSIDVEHGFALPDFDVKVNLAPGKEEIVEFTADKIGEFEFRCSVVCGSGHKEMTGKLIVE